MDASSQFFHVFETAGGFCGIGWSGDAITRFQLPTASAAATTRLMHRRLPGAEAAVPPAHIAAAIASVRRYFDGERVDFGDLKIDVGEQDGFFSKVYAAVRALAWGETTTYGAVAQALGAGREAARDVGQAMARNPVPLIIPCHRVLAAGRKVGGFSAPGGSDAKMKMLVLEGVQLASAPAPAPTPVPVQQSLDL